MTATAFPRGKAFIEQIGADVVIDYTIQRFEDHVRDGVFEAPEWRDVEAPLRGCEGGRNRRFYCRHSGAVNHSQGLGSRRCSVGSVLARELLLAQ